MIWQAITTCTADQWARYGAPMAITFERFWPFEASLTVYAEGFSGDDTDRVRFLDLDQAAPWLAPWKSRRSQAEHGLGGRLYDYRLDAVRFSHKVAAIGAAAETSQADVLLWLDADTITHAPVTPAWLERLFPQPADVAWLDRVYKYPECGVMMFRLPSARRLIRRIVTDYQSGAIFRLPQTHDSYVISQVVNRAVARGKIRVASLSGDARSARHPCVAGPLGECLDHLKGTSRKERGKSFPHDLITPRSEPYWRA